MRHSHGDRNRAGAFVEKLCKGCSCDTRDIKSEVRLSSAGSDQRKMLNQRYKIAKITQSSRRVAVSIREKKLDGLDDSRSVWSHRRRRCLRKK